MVLNPATFVCRLDMGDGDSHELPSFTGRVWLAAAAQLPKVCISRSYYCRWLTAQRA